MTMQCYAIKAYGIDRRTVTNFHDSFARTGFLGHRVSVSGNTVSVHGIRTTTTAYCVWFRLKKILGSGVSASLILETDTDGHKESSVKDSNLLLDRNKVSMVQTVESVMFQPRTPSPPPPMATGAPQGRGVPSPNPPKRSSLTLIMM